MIDDIDVCISVVLQGDMETSLGWQPIPLFDRKYSQELAAMQVIMFVLIVILVLSGSS